MKKKLNTDANITNYKIDFVILWVDGNDEKWLNEKNKYLNVKGDKNVNRFRDFNNLNYIFRGIEKYAPWVNKVFLVTWGHIPKFLNVNNEKLKVVTHDEFIPKEYLPTFNSNVIEMNLHRIKDLSEHFVLFNDDIFILDKLKPTDFFKNGIPNDMYIEYKKKNPSKRHLTLKNNYSNIINKYFSKHTFLRKNFFKVFNIKYGIKGNISSMLSAFDKNFNDFYLPHLTESFLKSTFEKIWSLENNALNLASKNKFRADSDIGQGICRYFQLLSGNFNPSSSLGKYYVVKNDNTKLMKDILSHKHKLICINDSTPNIDFEKAKSEINGSLEKALPKKCSFEL